jgi:MarR family 2-MHQ and catechol resistance regulon transcriptional repressor
MHSAPHIRLVLWKAAKAIERVDQASIAQTGLQLSGFAIMEVLLHKARYRLTLSAKKSC